MSQQTHQTLDNLADLFLTGIKTGIQPPPRPASDAALPSNMLATPAAPDTANTPNASETANTPDITNTPGITNTPETPDTAATPASPGTANFSATSETLAQQARPIRLAPKPAGGLVQPIASDSPSYGRTGVSPVIGRNGRPGSPASPPSPDNTRPAWAPQLGTPEDAAPAVMAGQSWTGPSKRAEHANVPIPALGPNQPTGHINDVFESPPVAPPDTPLADRAVAGVIGHQQSTDLHHAERHTPALLSSGLHRVEAVFLSNLPGFASPWLTQYAHHLADEHGPVGILHIDQTQMDVELVGLVSDQDLGKINNVLRISEDAATDAESGVGWGANQGAGANPGANPGGNPGAGVNPGVGGALFDRLNQLAPQPVQVWLVHLAGQLTDFTKHIAMQLSCWTLLSGADDAAVVADYQLLKQLLADDPSASKRHIGLMAMGSDLSKCESAVSKLNHTADRFLETPVRLLGSRQQMQPVLQKLLGSFAPSMDLWPGVQERLGACPGSVISEDLEQNQPAQSAENDKGGPHIQAPPTPPLMVGQASRLSSAGTADPTPPVPPAPPVPPTPPVPPVPQSSPSAQSTSQTAEAQAESCLANHLPGHVPLAFTYPRHQAIVWTLDQTGQLHLSLHSTAHCDAPMQSHLVDLFKAKCWAVEHLALLALTDRQQTFDLHAEPTMHLFTGHAKEATALVGATQTLAQIHLLQKVQVGGHVAWVCNDLN